MIRLPNQKTLAEILPNLARSDKALASLASVIGHDHMDAATEMMCKAELVGTLGDVLHDHFAENINDKADEVWGGSLTRRYYGDEEASSVIIREYEGVFFIEAWDDDPIQYFSSHNTCVDAHLCLDDESPLPQDLPRCHR